MRFYYTLSIAAALALLVPLQVLHAEAEASSDTVKLELQVDALTTLNDLNLTDDQLVALKNLATDTAGALSDPSAPITPEYKTALQQMRDTLLTKDEKRIDAAQDKLDDLADRQNPDPDPDITQSESAKTKSTEFLKMLSVKQIANFISENADDVDDPTQLLLDAIHQSHGLSDDDFESLRDDTSEELAVFADGPLPSKPPPIVAKVDHLLTRAYRLSPDEYNNQKPALEDEARKAVEGLEPIPCLRHWVEDELADFLSNPELNQSLDAWRSHAKK